MSAIRLGVLDIGSNKAQLQVVDLLAGAPPLPTHAIKEETRLGEEIQPDGTISMEGINRVANATRQAISAARRLSVDQLYVFATSAIRDAPNRAETVAHIHQASGVTPQFIDGADEARLTYLAVHRWYGWSAGRILVLDVGGGSMEIALGRDAEPDVALSLPLGAGRLTRFFLPADPPTREQLKSLRGHVRDTLREVSDRLRWEGQPSKAVATSKTFKQLARLAGAPPQRKGPFVQRGLSGEDVAKCLSKLACRTAKERANLRGISPGRARQILAGAVVAKETMDALDISRLDICPWALREGIMLRYLQSTSGDTRALPLQAVDGDQSVPQEANVQALRQPSAAGSLRG